jgi:23S rRNA pseudouridine1911/1915/1917 synthase
MFSKTSKALPRLNKIFADKEAKKTYWALVKQMPPKTQDTLIHWLKKNPKNNKSTAYTKEMPDAKKAILHYKVLKNLDHYYLIEVALETGRHHQIRSQLSSIGSPIKGDLKYGFDRSNPDASIHLHARELSFIHPVSNDNIHVIAPLPDEPLWQACQ